MKKHTLLAAAVLALAGVMPISAQISLVNPVPQKVTANGSALVDAPKSWKTYCDKARTGSIAEKTLNNSPLGETSTQGTYTITLGVKGDKSVKSVAKLIPAKAEGYYLNITEKGAVIAGADIQGLFYGVQTFLSSIAEGKMQLCTVTDYPDIPFRGTVEGFYGTPWSHKARLSQIEFYGRNKMNVYIYGPKDDPYHRDHWREPYPEAEALRIKELNEHAKENGVKFCWAIHPGIDIKWTDSDRDALIKKFETMYDMGVRSFAVFFDDIWGEGTRADKQADLLNYIDDNFIQKHHDCEPLVMCPTEYNRAWANDTKGYLRTLGQKMNKDVNIMWTGNSVVHCIEKEDVEWINSRIDRKAYIWWNFPVSDFVRDHILLGPAYGNGLDIAPQLSGFVSNPMEHAEASKISLYGIADYTWNMKAYDYKTDWEKGLKAVLPGNYEALRIFALYSKDLGQNGHGFRREEGDEIKALCESALQYNQDSITALYNKCHLLETACDILLSDKENPELIRELRPWLLQGLNVARYGKVVTVMTDAWEFPENFENFPGFAQLHAQALSIQQQMHDLENSSVRHALQPGIKLAGKVLLPTLNRLFTLAVDKYNAQQGTNFVNSAEYNPFTISSDVPQLALLPVTVSSNRVSVAPSLEVVKWAKDAAFTINSVDEITLAGMDFNFGMKDMAKNLKLEVLSGGQWKAVSLLHYSADDTVIHTGNELGGMKANALRLTNTSGKDLEILFKSFNFVKQ